MKTQHTRAFQGSGLQVVSQGIDLFSRQCFRMATMIQKQKGENIMLKVHRIMKFLACLALITSLFGCASTRTHEGTGEYIDDSAITTKVKAAIFTDSALKVFQINVETFKGEVQLSGFVDSRQMANKAEEVARGIHGVKGVKNNLIVK